MTSCRGFMRGASLSLQLSSAGSSRRLLQPMLLLLLQESRMGLFSCSRVLLKPPSSSGAKSSPPRSTKEDSATNQRNSKRVMNDGALTPTDTVCPNAAREDATTTPVTTTTAVTIEQLKEALVHLTRRTTLLTTELMALKQVSAESKDIARASLTASSKCQQGIVEVERSVQRLSEQLDRCELSASQSALRWQRFDAVDDDSTRRGGQKPGGAEDVAEQQTAKAKRACSEDDDGARRSGKDGGGVQEDTPAMDGVVSQFLLHRVESLASTVALLVNQQKKQQQRAHGGDPAHGGDAGTTDHHARPTSRPTQAPFSVTPISATVCPITQLLTVAGTQVIVRNVPIAVSASAIRTWCGTVAPVLSAVVVPLHHHHNNNKVAAGQTPPVGRSVDTPPPEDGKAMLVTFASVEDANRAVERLHGFAWAMGTSSQPDKPFAGKGTHQQHSHLAGGDKTYTRKEHRVLSVQPATQYDAAAAAAAVTYIPITVVGVDSQKDGA